MNSLLWCKSSKSGANPAKLWGFKRRQARNATLVYLPPADRPQTTLDLGELNRSKEHHEVGNETTKRYQQFNA